MSRLDRPTTTAVPRAPQSVPAPDHGCDSEEVLLARMRVGDEAAAGQLLSATYPRLLATARRFLGNDEDARDAVQEGLLAALRNIRSFHGDSRVSTWIHRIVVNACLMRLRRRRRRETVSIEDLLPAFEPDGHRIVARPAWQDPPDRRALDQERRDAVRHRMSELPDEYRAVLILRDVEGLDTADAASVLGISDGAVKTRLHRARMALRELLERDFAAPPR